MYDSDFKIIVTLGVTHIRLLIVDIFAFHYPLYFIQPIYNSNSLVCQRDVGTIILSQEMEDKVLIEQSVANTVECVLVVKLTDQIFLEAVSPHKFEQDFSYFPTRKKF